MASSLRDIEPDQQGLYPIRAVSSVTGVNSITLRAWERRYGLIKPTRTPKGHRLYSKLDIETIQRIVRLLESGISVGQVKTALEQVNAPLTAQNDQHSRTWEDYQELVLNAVSTFNDQKLATLLLELWTTYPADLVLRRLIRPLLAERAEHMDSLASAEAEHQFIAQCVVNQLSRRVFSNNESSSQPLILIAGIDRALCSVDALTMAAECQNAQFSIHYAGERLSVNSLNLIAKQRKPSAIITYLPSDAEPYIEPLAMIAQASSSNVWISQPVNLEEYPLLHTLSERMDDSIREFPRG